MSLLDGFSEMCMDHEIMEWNDLFAFILSVDMVQRVLEIAADPWLRVSGDVTRG